jgi:hypothetical protein
MASEHSYDIEVCNSLRETFHNQNLHRPMRVGRYDPGTRLTYEVTGVARPDKVNVHLEIEKFVGGGFAGQVYKVKILDIQVANDSNVGAQHAVPLQKDHVYAMKIMTPPSGFSRFFRSLLYRIGFQGPFQLQVNPIAVRAGAIWQKFIRRGAKIRFGDETAVNDIHATFVDTTLGSCGEISDWVDGRTWLLEVDDRMDLLKLYNRGKPVDPNSLGSPEYRAKKEFMKSFVRLLHDMGAHEFARQYEWSTCKSQPNCLKRKDTESDPSGGLMAVDFRAGLTLLPFLPMSPGDVKLIFTGIARGSLVQFDRGNLKHLEKFVYAHKKDFADMLPMLEELENCEKIYRNSIPDITHNHVRLFFSKRLWPTIFASARIGWRVKNTIDDKTEKRLRKSTLLTLLFYLSGIIPFLGPFTRRLWGRPDWRKHYGKMLTGWRYLKRSVRGKCAEKAIFWHRDGRVSSRKAQKIAGSFWRYFRHLPLSILPAGLHRFFTDWEYFKERLYNISVRPIKLYFSAPLREQWLQDMISQGQDKHMLSNEDARVIHSQLKEPFIQKYLKSLAVHVCTLPVTQIVSVLVSWIYVRAHPELSTAEAVAAVTAILVLFQVTPISPGSLVRGLYVVYMMIKDRSFKDYNIAVFLGFFKYIGYLAFPIQMTYRYPELARFMAGHWATEAVHIVPVFGERGALLEHWVYRLFYNWPLTIRRHMLKRAEIRASQKPRSWHVVVYAIAAAAVLGAADLLFLKTIGFMPTLNDTWWFALLIIVLCGAAVTLGCGGAPLSKRFISAAQWGVLSALLYTGVSAAIIFWVQQETVIVGDLITSGAWRVFIFTLFAAIAAAITELRPPGKQCC